MLYSSVLAVYLFYMQHFVSADPKLLLILLLPFPSVTVSLFPMSASLLLLCTEAHLFTVWIPPRGGVECYLSFSVPPPHFWCDHLQAHPCHWKWCCLTVFMTVIVCCVMTASYSLPCRGTGGQLLVLAFVNSAAANTGVRLCFPIGVFLGYTPRSRDCCLRWGLCCWLPEEPLLPPTMAAPTCFPSDSGGPPSPHPASVPRV